MRTDGADDEYQTLAARELEFEDRQRGAFALPPRLPDEGHIAGVAAGLADRFSIDVRAVRLAFVLVMFISGVAAVAYAALWALMPPVGERTVSFSPRAVAIVVAAALLVSGALAIALTS